MSMGNNGTAVVSNRAAVVSNGKTVAYREGG